MGTLILLPFGAVFVWIKIGVLPLSITSLLMMSAVLTVLDGLLFYLVKATFQREATLTEWK